MLSKKKTEFHAMVTMNPRSWLPSGWSWGWVWEAAVQGIIFFGTKIVF